MKLRVLTGDCRAVLATLPDESVDSCVTDPPYGLGFMGHGWDAGVPGVEFWTAVARVLKPGAYLLAFGGTRTFHRMACAVEDAGFEIRDQIGWAYGSGFPKSRNVGDGWGTALKPAWEPIAVARKPLIGTVAENILQHGTGALNIDGCRVVAERIQSSKRGGLAFDGGWGVGDVYQPSPLGRWPANLVHDGSDEVLACFPETKSTPPGNIKPSDSTANAYGKYAKRSLIGHTDEGSAARFFYCAKASRSERGEGNGHPTVKPVALMRWLCRLVTPQGGTVLDPFAGSGSTGLAASIEQFGAILIEEDAGFADLARQRIRAEGGLFAQVAAE